MMRIFRVLKLARFLGEANVLYDAIRGSRYKITVFLCAVISIVTIAGAGMYIIEGPEAGFSSIPRGIYWAIVTITTVGYGDIRPITPLGQALSSILMICGYGVIAVPTGIMSVELNRAQKGMTITTTTCQSCSKEGHDKDATFCKYCGDTLKE